MKVYTFSEARQQFSAVLDCAQKEGEVRVTRRDGRIFLIQPLQARASPLAVEGVDLDISKNDLLAFIHEGRRV
ncbi:MAG: type II toxin-antitoxin system Phd/YefM family antitoxin [Rhodoferax sp.]|nr:type II toxin-antitoxin system Phd/YefM family antitoxin [Rhodoferax sp.]